MALPKALPEIDPDRCTGCGRCVAACEPKVLWLETDGPNGWGRKRAVLHDESGCTVCVQCVVVCPFDAVRMVKTFVYGVGDYFGGSMKREEVFREMLAYLTLRHEEDSFLIEFRNLEEPLFGYRYFRANGYFPVKWLRVRNSIHQELIDKWMSASRKRQIHNGLKHGAVMEVARSEEDVCALFTMLRQYYLPKVHRYFPDIRFFLSLISEPSRRELGKIFVVKYKGKVIGGSVCLFSGDCAWRHLEFHSDVSSSLLKCFFESIERSCPLPSAQRVVFSPSILHVISTWLSPQHLFPLVEDFVIASYAPLSGEMERSWEFEFLLLLHGILLLLCFR
jgi:NAD-dependent dihydropyrimidine dehydrogenase PreA subunit